MSTSNLTPSDLLRSKIQELQAEEAGLCKRRRRLCFLGLPLSLPIPGGTLLAIGGLILTQLQLRDVRERLRERRTALHKQIPVDAFWAADEQATLSVLT